MTEEDKQYTNPEAATANDNSEVATDDEFKNILYVGDPDLDPSGDEQVLNDIGQQYAKVQATLKNFKKSDAKINDAQWLALFDKYNGLINKQQAALKYLIAEVRQYEKRSISFRQNLDEWDADDSYGLAKQVKILTKNLEPLLGMMQSGNMATFQKNISQLSKIVDQPVLKQFMHKYDQKMQSNSEVTSEDEAAREIMEQTQKKGDNH